jgi:heme iron utilization protein
MRGLKMETPKRDAMQTARTLLQAGGTGALSVLDINSGGPFTTLVNIATDSALRPVILISGLSHHTKCLLADPRASVMLHAGLAADADPMLTFRVSVSGRFAPSQGDEALHVFLARHPYAELYAGLGDFRCWQMEAEEAHIIAGFGRAYGVRFKDIVDLAT